MRRLTIILALLAVAAVSPATALGKAKGSDRPSSGTSSSTTTVDLATGTGSVVGSGQLSHMGRFTFTNDITSFTLTGPDTFSSRSRQSSWRPTGTRSTRPPPAPGP